MIENDRIDSVVNNWELQDKEVCVGLGRNNQVSSTLAGLMNV